MTALGTRPKLRPGAQVLSDRDVPEALGLCAQDPVASVLAASRLQPALQDGLARTSNELWGYVEDHQLVAICLVNANLIPVAPGVDQTTKTRALKAFAELALVRPRIYSSLVGPAHLVLDLWQYMAPLRLVARDTRPDQPSMVIDTVAKVAADPALRRSNLEEIGVVLPAAVAMFTEEVGYSPMFGSGAAYTARVRRLIEQGRSFVRVEADLDEPRVIFKAETPAVANGVAQIQGVWVTPDRRGTGLSEPGVAAVVALIQAEIAPVVSLYVNSYNERALATYRSVGFRQVDTWATIQL